MNKLLFFFKRPPLVLVLGRGCSLAREVISKILSDKKILIFDSLLPDFFLKKSKMPILVVRSIESREEILKIKKIIKFLSDRGFLVLNFDDDRARELRSLAPTGRGLTYGFSKKADIQATDLNINSDGANFKINYQGNIVPFWLKNVSEKRQIYNILAAVAVGIVRNMNLVEMSQKIKELS